MTGRLILPALGLWFAVVATAPLAAGTDGEDRRSTAGAERGEARRSSPIELAGGARRSGEPGYVEGELLVRYKTGYSRSQRRAGMRRLGLETADRLNDRHMDLVRFDSKNHSMAEIQAALEERPEVAYAEPNYRIYTHQTPDDPDFDELWGLNNTGQTQGTPDADIDAPEAWDTQTGTNNAVVVVIDTGIDPDHEDIGVNVWQRPTGVDTSFQGTDIGYDAVDPGTDPIDQDGHGTHVAGTVGAVGNNGTGVTGVNWDVDLLACRIFDQFGGSVSRAVDCLNYVLELKRDHGINIQVINASWGAPFFSQTLKDKIAELRDQNILFVTSAGNDGLNNDFRPNYPASYDLDNIVAVGATDDDDNLAGFSNFGSQDIEVAAPGVEIRSTLIGDTYGELSGTSMAAPHVAGSLALLQAQQGVNNTNYRRLRDALLVAGDRIDAFAQAIRLGNRINADRTLDQDVTSLPPVIRGLDPFRIAPGGEIVINGRRFGSSTGQVFFPSPDGELAGDVQAWSTGEVRVRVPDSATDGRLRLETADSEQATAPLTIGALLKRRATLNQAVLRAASANTGNLTVTMGGRVRGGSIVSTVQRYDAGTNSVSVGTPIPTATTAAAAGAINGKIYLAGGETPSSNGSTTALHIYDPDEDSWSRGSPMPTAVRLAGSAVIGGELYVVGGIGGASAEALVQIYDPTDDDWRLGPSLNQARFDHAAGTAGGDLYAVGGIGSGRVLSSVERLRPGSGAGWESVAGLPLARTGHAVASPGSQLFAFGGLNFSERGNCLDRVSFYDPESDQWQRLDTRLNVPRVDVAAAADGRTVRLMAGSYCDSTRVIAATFALNEALGLLRIDTIGASPSEGDPPLEVDFAASTSRAAGNVSYHWDFDDGSTSTAKEPAHTFEEEAFRNVELRVEDEDGIVATRTKRITVGDPEPAADDSSGGGGCAALPLNRGGSPTSYALGLPLLLVLALLGAVRRWRRGAW